MASRQRRLALALALGLGVLGGGGAWLHGPATLARIRRARELDRLLATVRALEPGVRDPAEESLVGFEDPEAVLALVERLRILPASDDGVSAPAEESAVATPDALRRAVELFALEPEPRDPGPRLALESLARERAGRKRFWARYLLDELATPTHACEPDGFAKPGTRVRGAWPGILAQVRAVSAMPIDAFEGFGEVWVHDEPDTVVDETPWRALVRIAQHDLGRVKFVGGRVVVERALEQDELPRSTLAFEGSGADSETILCARIGRRPGGERVGWFDPDPTLYRVAEEPALHVRAVAPTVFVTEIPPLEGADPERAIRAWAAAEDVALESSGTRFYRARARDQGRTIERIRAFLAGPGPLLPHANAGDYVTALAAREEPEAFLALVALLADAAPRVLDEPTLLVEAAELHAAHGPDPRALAALEAVARGSRPAPVRFIARYLLEELRAPTFPAPPPGVPGTVAQRFVAGPLDLRGELEEALGLALHLPPDLVSQPNGNTVSCSPWRQLLLVASRARLRVSLEPFAVRLVGSDAHLEALADPDDDELPAELREACTDRPAGLWGPRAVRALAALAGRRVSISAEGKVSLEAGEGPR